MIQKLTCFLFCLLGFVLLSAQPNIELNSFSSGFSNPVDIANAGDSRLFVVEQSGRIWIVDSLGNKSATPFLNRTVTSGGERGLLGLVFDPAYTTNGYFYIYYSQGSNSIISRYSVCSTNPNQADPGSEVVIMTIAQPFSNHNGGDLAFGQDGYLYIGLGDGGSGGDPGNRSQNPQQLLGKMLRIDVSTLPYTIPPTNPFVGDPSTRDEIWALGLRNPWRWSFDRETGDLWIADVGQGAREEISFTPGSSMGGENYGWRCYEGFNSFNTSGCGPASSYISPIHDYPRNLGTSVTGGFVYRGQTYPQLDGIYFFGDYNSGRLWGIWPDTSGGGGWTVHEYFDTSYRWSTFGEDAQGEIYGAHYTSGVIYRIDGVCPNFSVSLNASNATCETAQNGSIDVSLNGNVNQISFLWSNGDTTQDLSGLDSGKYILTMINAEGCIVQDSATITIDSISAPGITSVGPPAFCIGGSVTLVADSAPKDHSYQWFMNGMPLNGFTNQDFAVAVPGNYQVIWTGPCDVDTSAAIQIDVVPPPPTPAVSGDSSGTYCVNDQATLYSSLAPPGFTYQWYRDGNQIPTAQADSLVISLSGVYTVQFEGPCASAPSQAFSYTIEASPPPPIFASDSLDLCTGETLLIQGPEVPAGYGYQWYKNGNPIPGAIQRDFETQEAGAYALQFTGPCESPPSSSVEVSLRTLPQANISVQVDTLRVHDGVAWQWYQDGTPIPGANDSVYVVTTSDKYFVEVVNAFGCSANSDEVTVIASGLGDLFVNGQILITPNPAREQVMIQGELLKSLSIELSLIGINGQILYESMVRAEPGPFRQEINTEKLPAGIYLLRFNGEALNYTRRLLIVD